MALVTPNLALLLFAIILIIAAILAWVLGSYQNYDKGKFHTFISILAGLGVFVTFMFYYNVVQLQNQQQQLAVLEEIGRINDSVLNSILISLQDYSSLIPNFILSITPLTNTVCCTNQCSTEPDPINPQTCTAKMAISYQIFSLWQDVITSGTFLSIDPLSYVSGFLQRANSSQLYSQWNVSYIGFNNKTQTFGNLLFEYGLPIVNQTPEEYTSVAQNLINDPRYSSIFN